MSKLPVIVILSIVLFKNVFCSQNSDLVSVILIHRHGHRAPSESYKNDPNNSTDWGADMGHLTPIGTRQLFELGKWLRERYNGFLPRKYSSHDIQVISSDKDRCLMSAAACLAGLYPPEGDQIWNKDLLWQPIPIRMIPDHADALLKQKKRCAKHERLHREEMKKDHIQNMLDKNRELFHYISQKSGENISTLRQLRNLFTTLLTQSYFPVPRPCWVKEVFDKMKCLSILERTSYTSTTELARLKSGPLIDLLINHFESVLEQQNIPKFMMFSAHDTTLINIMNTMQIYNYKEVPDFADVLIFELRKDSEKSFVNILYKNSTDLERLNLKGCRFDCDFDKFKEVLAPVTISLKSWVRECFE